MTSDERLAEWWGALSEPQRAKLSAAAASEKVTAETVALLGDTGCPLGGGATGAYWAQQDLNWEWDEDMRLFIVAQKD